MYLQHKAVEKMTMKYVYVYIGRNALYGISFAVCPDSENRLTYISDLHESVQQGSESTDSYNNSDFNIPDLEYA